MASFGFNGPIPGLHDPIRPLWPHMAFMTSFGLQVLVLASMALFSLNGPIPVLHGPVQPLRPRMASKALDSETVFPQKTFK